MEYSGFRLHREVETKPKWEQRLRWSRQFKHMVKGLDGFFINIHDSKLFFIHQTAREFLTAAPEPDLKWKGRFDMPKSHSVISKTCLDCLLLPDLAPQARDNSAKDQEDLFINYAASNWPLHYILQEPATAD